MILKISDPYRKRHIVELYVIALNSAKSTFLSDFDVEIISGFQSDQVTLNWLKINKLPCCHSSAIIHLAHHIISHLPKIIRLQFKSTKNMIWEYEMFAPLLLSTGTFLETWISATPFYLNKKSYSVFKDKSHCRLIGIKNNQAKVRN